VQKTSDPFTSALLHLSSFLSSEWRSRALAEVSTGDCDLCVCDYMSGTQLVEHGASNAKVMGSIQCENTK